MTTYSSGTTTVTYKSPTFKDLFDPLFIGFDRFFENYSSANNSYPPYNVVKTSDTEYIVEIAVAGFGKEDIEITEQDGVLKIEGAHSDEHPEGQYLHRGVAARKFVRMFNLHDDIKVVEADIRNGLLQIRLEKIIPEEKKPKHIAIGSTKKSITDKA